MSGSSPSARARPAPSSAALSAAVTAAEVVVGGRRRRADRSGGLALAVAADVVNGHGERVETVERCAGERARHRVPSDEHGVGPGRARIGEDRLQRVHVAVDVVQDEDVHRAIVRKALFGLGA